MNSRKNSIKVSGNCFKFINSQAAAESRMLAARGAAELSNMDTVVSLFFLARDKNEDIRKTALSTVRKLDLPILTDVIKNGLDERIVTFILKYSDAQNEITINSFKNDSTGKTLTQKTTAPGKVYGSLDLFGLAELIQVLELNHRDAIISVSESGDKGLLYMDKGRLVHSTFRGKDGDEAFNSIFALQHPSFEYSKENTGDIPRTINKSAQNLIMNAMTNSLPPPAQPAEHEMFIEGDLDVLDMVELSQIFESNMKQASVEVFSSHNGTLFCNNGAVKHAVLGEREGVEAAYEIFTWKNGTFKVSSTRSIDKESIFSSMQGVVLEAMRLLDEKTRDSSTFGESGEKSSDQEEGMENRVQNMTVSERISQVFKGRKWLDVLASDQNSLVKKAIHVKVNKTIKHVLDIQAEFSDKKKAAEGVLSVSLVEKIVLLFYLAHDPNSEIRSIARKTLTGLEAESIANILRTTDIHGRVIQFLVRFFIDSKVVCNAAAENENTEEETLLMLIPKLDELGIEHIVERIPYIKKPIPVIEAILGSCDKLRDKEKLQAMYDKMVEEEGVTQVSGDISLISLPDIIQCIEQSRKTSVLAMQKEDKEGVIYFDKGNMVQAYEGDKEGESAFYAMFSWNDANFRMAITRSIDVPVSIKRNNQNLIMDAAMKIHTEAGTSKDKLCITGSSSVLDITELCLIYEANRKNCIIELQKGTNNERGVLFFGNGCLCDAEIIQNTKKTGEEAALTLISWSDVAYKIHSQAESSGVARKSNAITTPVYSLIMESMRLVDEGDIIDEGLPEIELEDDEFESLISKIQTMSISEKVKSAIKGDKSYRKILINDQNKLICTAVIKNPGIREDEIVAASQNRNINQDVLRLIARNAEWIKKYAVKLNLANNPKTPIEISMRYLNTFRVNDLILLSKNKNIASALATTAKKFIGQKTK